MQNPLEIAKLFQRDFVESSAFVPAERDALGGRGMPWGRNLGAILLRDDTVVDWRNRDVDFACGISVRRYFDDLNHIVRIDIGAEIVSDDNLEARCITLSPNPPHGDKPGPKSCAN
ncbi:MAG: hypothetical protein V1737_03020 [Chloroflexota bacterium]